jgi:CDP-6-deoxy-D-xylo-4-hexulose-3-dehydrase
MSVTTGFPLCDNKLGWEERGRAAELLLSGRQLSMGPETALLEAEFAAYMACPRALFVNSGSSANQLAVVAAIHPLRKTRLLHGDKVLVPALCWSTTVSPLVFQGLVPVFVDVCPRTLQMDTRHAAKLLVHVMGGCPDMDEVLALVDAYNLVFIEDACEAMGNTFRRKGWVHSATLGRSLRFTRTT